MTAPTIGAKAGVKVPPPANARKAAELEQESAVNLDQEIRTTVRMVQGGTSHLIELVAKAKETPNFLQLVPGKHADWKAYATSILSQEPQMHASIREAFSAVLTDEGMSLREVAKAMQISKSQVAKDIASVRNAVAKEVRDEAKAAGVQADRKPAATRTVGERLYDQLTNAVTDDSVKDVKKFTEGNLVRLSKELQRCLDLVDKQVYHLQVDAKVQELAADELARIRSQVEASLTSGVDSHPASRNRQGNQARTGRVA